MKTQLTYERYAHGEPPAAPAGDDLARMEALVRADEEFLVAHPPAAFFGDLAKKRRARSAIRWTALGSALAASMAIALVSLLAHPRDDGTRMKGADVNMFVYHKTDGGTEILEPQTALSRGDEIQIAYFAREPSYAAIVSIDGRGSLTRHMPLHGSAALEIRTKDFALLPYSYRLDDAPGFEDLYFVVSPRPFKLESIEPFVKAGFDNETTEVLLPEGFRFAAFRVKKTEAKQ